MNPAGNVSVPSLTGIRRLFICSFLAEATIPTIKAYYKRN